LRFPEGRLSDKNSLPDRQAVLGRVKRRYVDVYPVERDQAVFRFEHVAERQGDPAAVVARVGDLAFAYEAIFIGDRALQLMAQRGERGKETFDG
jgi:hypothetical protein